MAQGLHLPEVTNAFYEWPEPGYFSAYHYIRPKRGFKFGILWPFPFPIQ